MPNQPKLTVEYTLPCGHKLEHSCSSEKPHHDWLQEAGVVLKYWLNERIRNHDCSLVSPDNPTGNRELHKKRLEAARAN